LKRTLIILLLGIILLMSGCGPFVLNTAETVGIIDDEPIHLRIAKDIPAPEYLTCTPVDQTNINIIFEQTNTARTENDLPELSLSPTLCKLADLRAADMAEEDYFDHVSPAGESVFTLLQEYQILYFNSGENIGKGCNVTDEAMVEAWMDSPGHKANILSDVYHQIGIGIAVAENGVTYWVQVFTN